MRKILRKKFCAKLKNLWWHTCMTNKTDAYLSHLKNSPNIKRLSDSKGRSDFSFVILRSNICVLKVSSGEWFNQDHCWRNVPCSLSLYVVKKPFFYHYHSLWFTQLRDKEPNSEKVCNFSYRKQSIV